VEWRIYTQLWAIRRYKKPRNKAPSITYPEYESTILAKQNTTGLVSATFTMNQQQTGNVGSYGNSNNLVSEKKNMEYICAGESL
jgi:hypothetical protein